MNVITESGELEPFNTDWLRKYKGNSSVALLPNSTQQISALLSYCNQKEIAVVPQGGNTGLVGGSVPVFDEVIISTKKLNRIRHFDPISGIVTVDAGVILQQIEDFLEPHHLTIPFDLAAKGSCHIGGNVATNAGGIRLLKYGSLHGNVIGLEAVLANGTIVSDLMSPRKNNTGYDIKQLFIGSEGTLGFVTAVSLLAPPKPADLSVSMIALSSFEAILHLFQTVRKSLGDTLFAFEYMDDLALSFVLAHDLQSEFPFTDHHPYYVILESSSDHQVSIYHSLFPFLEPDVIFVVVSPPPLSTL